MRCAAPCYVMLPGFWANDAVGGGWGGEDRSGSARFAAGERSADVCLPEGRRRAGVVVAVLLVLWVVVRITARFVRAAGDHGSGKGRSWCGAPMVISLMLSSAKDCSGFIPLR